MSRYKVKEQVSGETKARTNDEIIETRHKISSKRSKSEDEKSHAKRVKNKTRSSADMSTLVIDSLKDYKSTSSAGSKASEVSKKGRENSDKKMICKEKSFTEMAKTRDGCNQNMMKTVINKESGNYKEDQEQPSMFQESRLNSHDKNVHRVLPKSSGQETNVNPQIAVKDRWNFRIKKAAKCFKQYRTIIIAQVLLAFYVGFLTYADIGHPGGLRDSETGLIVDRESPERTTNGIILVHGTERSIVAATRVQVACIGITRMSAFFMYPRKCLVLQVSC